MIRRIKFWGLLIMLLLLAGCDTDVPYNADKFKASKDNCWPCEMYMQAFKAMDGVLDNSLNIICQNSLMVLELALLFWLLFRVGRVVISFSMPDMKKEFASFITVLFKAMIVAIFLNNPTYLYDFFGGIVIQPIGDGFLSMANTVLETPSDVGVKFNYDTGINFLDEIAEQWKKFFPGGSSAGSVSGLVVQCWIRFSAVDNERVECFCRRYYLDRGNVLVGGDDASFFCRCFCPHRIGNNAVAVIDGRMGVFLSA